MSLTNYNRLLRQIIDKRVLPGTIIGSTRSISNSSILYGRRNFRKFPIPNKRGVWEHHKIPKDFMENEYAERVVAIDDLRIRYPGIYFGKKFVYVREMEPELVVPDNFEDSPLKPYVSYATEDIVQSEFTAQQLFNVTYGREISKKIKNKEEIPKEYLEFDEKAKVEAKNRALKTGADLFSHTSYFGCLNDEWRYGHK